MESKCATCKWREKSEKNPKSFMARIWRFHTKFCPGWKAYQKELAKQQASRSHNLTAAQYRASCRMSGTETEPLGECRAANASCD